MHLGRAARRGVGGEHAPDLVEERALLVGRERADVADAAHPVDDLLGRQPLLVRERRRDRGREPRLVAERVDAARPGARATAPSRSISSTSVQTVFTHGTERSRWLPITPRRPPGRSTRWSSASAASRSNQWIACATVIASSEPARSGSASAIAPSAGTPGTAADELRAHPVDRLDREHGRARRHAATA